MLQEISDDAKAAEFSKNITKRIDLPDEESKVREDAKIPSKKKPNRNPKEMKPDDQKKVSFEAESK